MRKDSVIDLDTEDIIIFVFKDNDKWSSIADPVLLYDGIQKDRYDCTSFAGDELGVLLSFYKFSTIFENDCIQRNRGRSKVLQIRFA